MIPTITEEVVLEKVFFRSQGTTDISRHNRYDKVLGVTRGGRGRGGKGGGLARSLLYI
jgi:hypothetical protein